MKEQPDLNKMIDKIQQIIDSSKNNQVLFLRVGTLMHILYLLKEKEEKNQPKAKQDKPEFAYILSGTLYTDGDFRVAVNEFHNEKFCKHIRYDDHTQKWKILLVTKDPYYVRDFLEELVVSYRCYTHYWLIPHLYNMTAGAIDCIFNDEKNYHAEMGGNYEGTEITLKKVCFKGDN